MLTSTCENENVTFRRARIVQGSCQPQDDHRVDRHNVTHMLIQVEVL